MDPEHWRKVEHVYHAALKRDPNDRSEFLNEICGDDEDLKREVRSFLAQDVSARGVPIDRPAWDDRASLLGETAAVDFAVGSKVGPYRIEGLLGKGGMGVVYRACDTKLNRPVAVKFLSGELSSESRRRFQREAQLASSLNHPNIVTVHDAGELDGTQYLVTEFVDGGTLKDWLRSERRSWRQIVELLAGVADALATAHQAGIMHRDIKPANILVSTNGYVKLGDFGLAKVIEAPDAGSGTTNTIGGTRPGIVVGTVAYMSPEQAYGRRVDARSDIFSFAVVLYESVSGRRPFAGDTDLEMLKAIAQGEPQSLSQDLPIALRMVVGKALEKDPGERYQAMRELVIDLRRLSRQRTTETVPAVVAPNQREWLPWVALVLVIGGAGLWIANRPPPPPDNPLTNAQFTRFTDFPGSEQDAAISPDGRFVAFLSDRDGPFDAWISQVGTGRFLNLTEGQYDELRYPFLRIVGFSGDGAEVFIAGDRSGRRLQLLPLMGGTSRTFLGERVVNVAWSADNAHLVYHTNEDGDPMFVADRTGGDARRIFIGERGMHGHFPVWSPDGEWIYFVRGTQAPEQGDVWRIAASGGEPQRLTRHESAVRYPAPLDDRTLLYVAPDRDGSGPCLWALDIEYMATRRISFGLEKYTSVWASSDGRRLVATVANPTATLWSVPILDRIAEEDDVRPFPLPAVRALAPRFGGKSLFYLSARGTGDGLWRFDDGEALEVWRGVDGSLSEPPAVSPDGSRVAVVLSRQGTKRLEIISVDGGQRKTVTAAVNVQGTACWSPDGEWIVTGGSVPGGAGLFKIRVDGTEVDRLVSGTALNPVWSPADNLIVYAGVNVDADAPLLGVDPSGAPVELPPIRVRADGERFRFLSSGEGLVYVQGLTNALDFWLLQIATGQTRRLTRFRSPATIRTFDIRSSDTQIVFDRLQDNSDIVMIDRPQPNGL